MEKLKTLKEIDGTKYTWFDENQKEIPEREICESDLKEEAIKWINIGGSLDKFLTEEDCWHQEEAICNFIQHFFNITEEELNISHKETNEKS